MNKVIINGFVSCLILFTQTVFADTYYIHEPDAQNSSKCTNTQYWWKAQDHSGFTTRAYQDGLFYYTHSENTETQNCIWTQSHSGTNDVKIYAWVPKPDPIDSTPNTSYTNDYRPTTSATYMIYHDNGQSVVYLNQNVSREGWYQLGSQWTVTGNFKVKLSDKTNEGRSGKRVVAFDAIKIVEINNDQPDLIIKSIDVNKTSMKEGDSYSISTEPQNIGSAQSTGTTLRYVLSNDSTIAASDTEIGTDVVGRLNPNQSDSESIVLSAPSDGTYYVGACLDTKSSESDTTNNCSEGIQINVAKAGSTATAKPDLIITNFSVSDTSFCVSDKFSISLKVKNQGGKSSNSTKVRYYRSPNELISSNDTELGTDNVSSLSAGKSSSEAISNLSITSAGTYYIGACVDSISGESSSSNNCESSGTKVVVSNSCNTTTSGYDWVATASSPDEGKVKPGFNAVVRIKIFNNGDTPSPQGSLTYYLSDDNVIDQTDTEVGDDEFKEVTKGDNRAEATTVKVPSEPGTYYYGACIDPGSNEDSTSNNCSNALKFVVEEPEEPVPAECGSADDKVYPANVSGYGSDTQCTSGQSSNSRFPVQGGSVSWECNNGPSSDNVFCIASREANPVITFQESKSTITKCNTLKNPKYCVVLDDAVSDKGHTINMVFSVSDKDNDVSHIVFDVDGNEGPGAPQIVNVTNGDVNFSHKYAQPDYIPNPSETYFGKNVLFTAKVVDDSGNSSSLIEIPIHVYVHDIWKVLDDRRIELEDEEQDIQDSSDSGDVEEDLAKLISDCTTIKFPKLSFTLKKNDPVKKDGNGDLQLDFSCRDEPHYSGAGFLLDDGSSLNYHIYADHRNFYSVENGGKDKCDNYPAHITAKYTFEGEEYFYPNADGYVVNNYADKQLVISTITSNLITIAKGGDYICRDDDQREKTLFWSPQNISNQSSFDPAVDAIAGASSKRQQYAKGAARGASVAAKEILADYVELAFQMPPPVEAAGKILNTIKSVANGSYDSQEYLDGVKQQAENVKVLAETIAGHIHEVAPLVKDSLSQFSPEEQAYWVAYFGAHIGHEFLPTSKAKLLKLSKKGKVPKWLVKALVTVKMFGAKIDLKSHHYAMLDKGNRLEVVYQKFVKKKSVNQKGYDKNKDSPFSQEDEDDAKELSGVKNDAEMEKLKQKWWLGTLFNKKRNKFYQRSEIYVCRIPSCKKPANADSPYVRLDSYNDVGDKKWIVSRKNTQLKDIKLETAKGYINELSKKYPPGAKIATVPTQKSGSGHGNDGLAGKTLKGQMVLEVPDQKEPIPKELIAYAKTKMVIICQISDPDCK